MGLCALWWHWDPQHPFPASPVYPETPTSPSVSAPNEPKMSFVPEHPRGPGCSQKKNHCSHFHHQSQPWGVPSPLIPVTPSPPMDAAPTPRSVSKENQPLVVSPPLPPSLAGCFSPPLLLPSSSKYAFRAIRRLFSLWNKCSLPGFEHRGGGGTHTDLMTVI